MTAPPPPRPRPARTAGRRPVTSDSTRLFSRADARAAGWTDGAIRHAAATGRWVRIASDAYAITREGGSTGADVLLRAVAGQHNCSRAVISHAPAAILWALPTVCDTSRPCLTVPAGTALRGLSGIHLHRATLASSDVVEVGGRRCTAVARTVTDLAREHNLDAGVAAGDAALRLGLMTRTDLDAAVQGCSGWPGAAAAARTAEFVSSLAESPLESLSRLRLAASGLPMPELQVEIGDEYGNFVARVDFYWPEFGVVGEADGNVKYQRRADLIDERRRQRRLEKLGLVVIRWEWADLNRFAAVASELQAAFARGIRPGGGRRWGVLRSLHPGW